MFAFIFNFIAHRYQNILTKFFHNNLIKIFFCYISNFVLQFFFARARFYRIVICFIFLAIAYIHLKVFVHTQNNKAF